MDDERFAKDLASKLTPGSTEERVVAGFVCEHRGEVSASGVSADQKALAEIPFKEGRVRGHLIRKGCGDEVSSRRRKC